MILWKNLYIIALSDTEKRKDENDMFIIYNDHTKFPIKAWLENECQLEEQCLEQAYHLSQLPFVHKWVCLMPDTHTGKGMPIGGMRKNKFYALFLSGLCCLALLNGCASKDKEGSGPQEQHASEESNVSDNSVFR